MKIPAGTELTFVVGTSEEFEQARKYGRFIDDDDVRVYEWRGKFYVERLVPLDRSFRWPDETEG